MLGLYNELVHAAVIVIMMMMIIAVCEICFTEHNKKRILNVNNLI